MKPSFNIIDHPADMGIEAYGISLKEAFEQAAYGLLSIILDISNVGITKHEYVQVHANDREQLLVRWLNEILYCYDGRQFAPKEFIITEISNTSLNAEVRGEYFLPSVHRTKIDVKAITYHQLLVKEEKDRYYVRVYVDI